MHHRHAVMQHVFSQNIFTLGGPAQDAFVLVCYEGMTPLITRYSFSVTNQHQARHLLCKAPNILHNQTNRRTHDKFCKSSRSGKLDKRSCKEPWAHCGNANWPWNSRLSGRNCPHFQHLGMSTQIGKSDEE